MKKTFLYYFFKFTVYSLGLSAVFPKKKPLKSRFRMFFMYKVWPVVFIMLWVPVIAMAFTKAVQFYNNKAWEELLDITHKLVMWLFTLYMMFVIQIASSNYQTIMDVVEEKFRSKNDITLRDFLPLFLWWVFIMVCFIQYAGTSIYNRENMVPLWVPFVDNNKDLSFEVYCIVWVYEMMISMYVFAMFAIWCPFIIVSTVCVCKELDCLVGAVNWYASAYIADGNLQPEGEGTLRSGTLFRRRMPSSQDMVRFVRKLVQHHIIINSVISHVARISNYVFLTQTITSVVLSCVVTFNLYYTTEVEKLPLIKSFPVMFVSYYLMFTYCWNGQNLTDKSEELARTIYYFPWHNCPGSYRSSMLIMMEVLKRPVFLRGGGIIRANFVTFITCAQQTFSYILILKSLTPEKGPA